MLEVGVIGVGSIGGEICKAIDEGVVHASVAGISNGESGGTPRLSIAVDFSAFPIRRFTISLLRPFRQSQSASPASQVSGRSGAHSVSSPSCPIIPSR